MTNKYANEKHWTTTDGHRYASVPAKLDEKWARAVSGGGLHYFNGPYKIVSNDKGHRRSYRVYRDNILLPLSFHSLLRDAKAYAEKNARGEFVINVA